jgi:carboxymethylenebutenolidase
MRTIIGVTAVAVGLGVGFAAGRAKPAQAVADEHAGHDMAAMTLPGTVEQMPGIPASGAGAKERLEKSGRHGEWVAIKVNATDSVMAWVVYPERRDKAPVVIAIHENTGINSWTRNVADQLAADGFIGIAPDLTTMFRTTDLRQDPTQEEGRAAIPKVTPEIGNAIIDAVARYGASLPASTGKVGIVGFCWGGGRSFGYATHNPNLGASVVYYGTPPNAQAMANIGAPVLGLYGGNDARISATVPATDSAMKALGKSYQFQVFEGAGHGFLRAQNDVAANPNATPQQLEAGKANQAAAVAACPPTVAFSGQTPAKPRARRLSRPAGVRGAQHDRQEGAR